MSLNVGKIKYTLLNKTNKNSSNKTTKNGQLHIGGQSLSKVTETSFLGIIINENLN